MTEFTKGYILGLETAIETAHNYDQGSSLFEGFTWGSYIKTLRDHVNLTKGGSNEKS